MLVSCNKTKDEQSNLTHKKLIIHLDGVSIQSSFATDCTQIIKNPNSNEDTLFKQLTPGILVIEGSCGHKTAREYCRSCEVDSRRQVLVEWGGLKSGAQIKTGH